MPDVATSDPSPIEFFQLVSEPLRWSLLCELARSDRRVSELTELADKPQSLVSYHLRELRNAGLISVRRSSADGRDSYYCADVARCAALMSGAVATLQPGLRFEPVETDLTALRMRPKPRVLFLCTGNSARSQIAEALLEHLSEGRVEARSAGSNPKALHPMAVRVLANRGIDISDRSAKHLSRFARTRFDRVVTLCDRVREVCPEFSGDPEHAHWSIADPALEGDTDELTYEAFERTTRRLEDRVQLLLADLTIATPREEPTWPPKP